MGSRWENSVLLLGRVVIAGYFVPSAVAKLSNLSGFAVSLAAQGLPYADVLAAIGAVALVFGPLALACGLAPRLTASVLIGLTLSTTVLLHRFWELRGAARIAEQAVFLSNLGIAAGLLFYLVSGPGAWSIQGWRKGGSAPSRPAASNRRAQPVPRPA